MVWREVKPWRRELREDFSFVSADLGPRDLAPLARAVSDLSCDGMWRSWIQFTPGDTRLFGIFCGILSTTIGVLSGDERPYCRGEARRSRPLLSFFFWRGF